MVATYSLELQKRIVPEGSQILPSSFHHCVVPGAVYHIPTLQPAEEG